MKYYKPQEDKEILKGRNDYVIAGLTGFDPSYIWTLRAGKRIASWKSYKKLKKVLTDKKYCV